MNKEAIKLIEEAIIHTSMIQSNQHKPGLIIDRLQKLIGYCGSKGILDQALTILKKPKCDTCGDSKKKYILDKRYKSVEYAPPEAITVIPCPDCQQPPAGEWMKSLEHIKSVLSAAIARPNEIATDWKEFLLKFVEREMKG